MIIYSMNIVDMVPVFCFPFVTTKGAGRDILQLKLATTPVDKLVFRMLPLFQNTLWHFYTLISYHPSVGTYAPTSISAMS